MQLLLPLLLVLLQLCYGCVFSAQGTQGNAWQAGRDLGKGRGGEGRSTESSSHWEDGSRREDLEWLTPDHAIGRSQVQAAHRSWWPVSSLRMKQRNPPSCLGPL